MGLIYLNSGAWHVKQRIDSGGNAWGRPHSNRNGRLWRCVQHGAILFTGYVADKLVWLPTWHQARLLAMRLGVDQEKISGLWSPESTPSTGDELLGIHRLIMETL